MATLSKLTKMLDWSKPSRKLVYSFSEGSSNDTREFLSLLLSLGTPALSSGERRGEKGGGTVGDFANEGGLSRLTGLQGRAAVRHAAAGSACAGRMDSYHGSLL